ncbi:MAG: TonB C-terminal domain-containing protein [bacterium]
MNVGAPLTPQPWRTGFSVSLLVHGVLTALLVFGPAMGWFTTRNEPPEVMLVRLRGGGENVPGWIKPTMAPSDQAVVPDNKPKPRLTPKEESKTPPKPEEKRETPTAPAVKKTTEVKPDATENVKPESAGETAEPTETTASTQEGAGSEAAEVAGETGEGIGAKPGPEGSGFSATSDTDFPGADTFLSRVEAEVQRRFNFRGRGTGAVAEYHLYIDKRGKMLDLLLVTSSGISSLDLAARSALVRAKFPPLPPGYVHDRLGVTYRFYDAK